MIKRLTYSFFCLATITILLCGYTYSLVSTSALSSTNLKDSKQKFQLKNKSNQFISSEIEEENDEEENQILNPTNLNLSTFQIPNPFISIFNYLKKTPKNKQQEIVVFKIKDLPIWLSTRQLIL